MSSNYWKNFGLIWELEKIAEPWMKSHMAVPVVEQVSGDIYRAYFCSRDDKNRSQIGSLLFDINEPGNVLDLSSAPILTYGALGEFDDSGVTPTCVINHDNKKYLYYVGWNQGVTVRMYLYIGLAISEDGGLTFKKYSQVPILDRSRVDPFLTATLSIYKEDDFLRMWYVSGDRWENRPDGSYPFYNIKYAESKDGIFWLRNGVVCIDYSHKDEHAIARPCVLKDGNLYKMWYSFKGKDYSIGYAESTDGFSWRRMDADFNMTNSPDSFDSSMREYACVIQHKGKKFMFFNGNDYGKYGIGIAEEL